MHTGQNWPLISLYTQVKTVLLLAEVPESKHRSLARLYNNASFIKQPRHRCIAMQLMCSGHWQYTFLQTCCGLKSILSAQLYSAGYGPLCQAPLRSGQGGERRGHQLFNRCPSGACCLAVSYRCDGAGVASTLQHGGGCKPVCSPGTSRMSAALEVFKCNIGASYSQASQVMQTNVHESESASCARLPHLECCQMNAKLCLLRGVNHSMSALSTCFQTLATPGHASTSFAFALSFQYWQFQQQASKC